MSSQKMHDDEVHTDAELVRSLVATQFPDWAGLSVEPVESAGTDNAIYRLGDDMTARLPRIHWAVGNVDREFEWLPRLAPHLHVKVPVPLAKGHPGQGFPWPWTVCRWLEGENPAVDAIADPGSLASDLAGFVSAMRRIDPTDGPPAGRGVPLKTKAVDARTAIGALRNIIDTDAATAAWEAALRAPSWTGSPVWIHGDLSPGNVLCVDGRLSAVIDFGIMGVGDPAGDLTVAWNLLPADAREIFRREVAIDEATWTRGRGWALFQALGAVPYYQDRNPVLAANARHVINEILTEHRNHT